jgi:hypothetical protein
MIHLGLLLCSACAVDIHSDRAFAPAIEGSAIIQQRYSIAIISFEAL